MQIAHCLDDSFIAQVLRLFVKNDGCFQIRPEAAVGFQSCGQRRAIKRQTMGTGRAMLPGFNHQRFDFGQFDNLPALKILRRNTKQIGQALLAFGDRNLDYLIWIVQ